jgi:hypothetical protein
LVNYAFVQNEIKSFNGTRLLQSKAIPLRSHFKIQVAFVKRGGIPRCKQATATAPTPIPPLQSLRVDEISVLATGGLSVANGPDLQLGQAYRLPRGLVGDFFIGFNKL